MEPAELTSHLGYLLRQVSNHVSQAFARKLESKDITVAEWAVMRSIFELEGKPSQLASRMGMTKGAMSKLEDRLIAKSLMLRTENLEDRRSHFLRLSKKGEGLVPKLAAIADQNEVECLSHLSEKDRVTLERILKQSVKHYGLTSIPIN